jgi:hypothetical protein
MRFTAFLTAVLALIGPAVASAQVPKIDFDLFRARANPSATYKVDPTWPIRPSEAARGPVPGLSVDRRDHVWVFTRAVPPVQVFRQDGTLVRAWGEADVKTAHAIRFGPDGTVWLADVGKHTVSQFTPEGRLLRTLGTPNVAGCDPTHFDQPTDMVVTAKGDIFVTDGYGNNRVVHFDRDGKFVKAWGEKGPGPGQFRLPHAIAMDSLGKLYVADRSNARIQVFDQDGRLLDTWRDLLVPWGLWITPDDQVWACGSSPMPWERGDVMLGVPPKDQLFLRLDTAGRVQQLWTVPLGDDNHDTPGSCNWLHAVAIDSLGNLYAGDIKGRRAQKFVPGR